MTKHAVVIAGGGPTGLMLAAELTLAKVDVAVVERRDSQVVVGTRARGIHTRTIEVLDQRGVAERFISEGTKYPIVPVHPAALDISDAPTRHNYTLGILQQHVERILAAWVDELGVKFYRGRDVTGFTQDDTGVDVTLSDGSVLRTEYLVGCDGGRSVVRKTAEIAFPGWDPTISWLIAEVETTAEPAWGFRETAAGRQGIGKLPDSNLVGIVLTEPRVRPDDERTLRDLSEQLVDAYGTDFGVHSPRWISSFTDMTRQAAAYRDRRVLLAGDAAHVHSPVGGQGLNLGLQDAVNLGWKLAQVVKRVSPDALLDTYHAERHPVGARALKNNMVQVALARTDDRSKAMSDTVAELLKLEESRKRWAAELSGLAIRYDFGEGHPLLGRRMPDLEVTTAAGPRRVFMFLHEARPVLLNFGEAGSIDIIAWSDRVQLVDATYAGAWELPAIGAVTAPTAALVRPDGYVAWVGERTQAGLTDALARWLGSAK